MGTGEVSSLFWFGCVSFTGRVGRDSFTGGVGRASFTGCLCVTFKGEEMGRIGDMKSVNGGVGVVMVVVVERLNRDDWLWGEKVRSGEGGSVIWWIGVGVVVVSVDSSWRYDGDGGMQGSAQSDFSGWWVGVGFVVASADSS